MSKPAGYYDWNFQQRKAYDDAQVERENAEYEREQAERKRQRAEREAREAREHAKTEIYGWQQQADNLNDEKLEIEAERDLMVKNALAFLRRIRAIHDDMNPAVALDTHNDLREAIEEFATLLKDYN